MEWKKVFFVVLSFLVLSCSINTKVSNKQYDEVKSVLIIGNSITLHEAKPSIGWHGSWGMAASVQDSDFVHIIKSYFLNIDSSIHVEFENIFQFETDFSTYDLTQLKHLKDLEPDLIICRLGENVNEKNAKQLDFDVYLESGLQYLKTENTRVICTDSFWPKEVISSQIEDVCERNYYDFVSIASLYSDSTNMAYGLFENAGVARHPSDKGMRLIAERIIAAIARE